MGTAPRKKHVFAISSGRYKGIDIFETGKGIYAICLGFLVYSSRALPALTKLIDEWFDTKKN